MPYRHQDLTDGIINAFYHVYNTLGFGFLERVYENALAYELRKRSYTVVQQAAIKVTYDEVVVGEYYADILVNGIVILELKSVDVIGKDHESQLVNYLRATDIEIGLILNFGPNPQVRRKIYDSARRRVPKGVIQPEE